VERRLEGGGVENPGSAGALEPQQLHVESGKFLCRSAFVRTQDTWMHMHLHTKLAEEKSWAEIEGSTPGNSLHQ